MKKIIILVLISLFVLTGCSSDLEKSKIKVSKSDVKFYVKEGTLTRSGATLILKNNGDKILNYGEPYEIEKYEDGSWRKIEADLNFIMPLYGLNPGEEKEINLDWEYGYGKLNKGKYRVLKNVYFEGEEQFYIDCEFEV